MTIFHHELLTREGMVLANEMNLNLKSMKPKRLMGLKVHYNGFKLVNFLGWLSVVEGERERC